MTRDSLDALLADLPDVLTPEECSEVLRVPKSTMRKLLSDGVIPSVKVGPRITRILRRDLQEFIETSYGAQHGDEAPGE